MYRTHEEFITWASKYEDEDQVGRNIVSQKKFIKYFSKSSKNIIKFEEDLNIEIIVNQSMKFLKV